MNFQSITYRIDAADTIVFTNAVWFEFARSNEFAKPDVTGTSLWSHITDTTTAHIYQSIVDRVRTLRQSVQVSFRCDAPAERRFMLLKVSPEQGGDVVFRSAPRKTESRPRVLLVDSEAARSEDFLTMCSWCKRLLLEAQWLEIEHVVERLRLFTRGPLPQLTHSICPSCAASFNNAALLSA